MTVPDQHEPDLALIGMWHGIPTDALPDWTRPEPFEHDRPTPDPCPPCDSRRQIEAFREWVDTYPPFQTGEGSSA